ncbi:hypothetical protein [Novosphingobium sp. JCM 18896]|uniref:hypothetical protein n=1 Tax=Novosphingobium sp. JCM 18896 TaxID=2989731 RepID=UPI002223D9F0|nr:hypothetical protein [Novosphingobium sp. JCM 18896]MCW1430771.1 hypothetical protein [Novosphingobium sp. JCM 18896]
MTNLAKPATHVNGELILLWAMPVIWIFWLGSFLAFPGFVTPMSPKLSAQEVAAFYFDPANLPRIRYSMIVFNWFGVALIPFLAMIAMQVQRMAHRTPILTYCFIGCIAGGPTLFCIADLFWLIAAFRPERDPALVQLFNDMAWVTFTSQVAFLIAQNVFLAVAIHLDRQPRPIFPTWVAHFNLATAPAMAPAAFAAIHFDGPIAWDGALSFGLKNGAIALWIVVMTLVTGQAVYRQRHEQGAAA